MRGWLGKSVETSRRRPVDRQPFDYNCPCGQHVSGDRQEREQRILCPKCGDPYFILPANPYPLPAPPKPVSRTPEAPSDQQSGARKKKKKRRRTKPATTAVELVALDPADDDEDGIELELFDTPVPPRVGGRAVAESSLGVPLGADRSAVGSSRWRMRAMIASVVALIVATVAWRWQHSAVEEAEREIVAAIDGGHAALEVGDLEAASTEFGKARVLADQLGRDDKVGFESRQYDRELEAATNLATASLLEIFTEAERARQANQLSSWQQDFKSRYAGLWMVLETNLTSQRKDTGGFQTKLANFPLSIQGVPVTFDAPLQFIEQLPMRKRGWFDVIVAVQLVDCEFDDSAGGQWVVQLDPKSAFLWCHKETLAAVGLVDDVDAHPVGWLDDLLRDQTEAMESFP